MNELYALLIVGALTSALVSFSSLLDESLIDIKSVTRNITDGKSVYEIELVKNNNQFYDVIVDPSISKVATINDTS
jgi:hypothetical protein